MTRLQEIQTKHDCLRALLGRHQADGLLLRRTRNIAWFTAGADASLAADSDYGAYSLIVTPDKRFVLTNTIEAPRLRLEERLEDLGFELMVSPWYQAPTPPARHLLADEAAVERELQGLRWRLLPGEQERLRALGRDTAAVLDAVIRLTRPGDTEFEIAARLDAACRERGGFALVNRVATDERIRQFRHPLPTRKCFEHYVMLVVCLRRGGLVVSATRLAYFGKLPSELREKAQKVAAIDAAVMAASQVGRTLGDVFSDLLAAYREQGEGDQWQQHHQGGITGYAARERLATPGDPAIIYPDMALAWNPSMVGCKSEDTILVHQTGFEIVSLPCNDWPMLEIEVKGQRVPRPGILEL